MSLTKALVLTFFFCHLTHVSSQVPPRLPPPTFTITSLAAAPELTPFDFYTASCPGMMSEFARGSAACEAKKTAAAAVQSVLTQSSANDLLQAQAVCLCNYTYSPLKPHVQVLLGRCRNWAPSQAEFNSIYKHVTQCTDNDHAGLAMDVGLSVKAGGAVSHHVCLIITPEVIRAIPS